MLQQSRNKNIRRTTDNTQIGSVDCKKLQHPTGKQPPPKRDGQRHTPTTGDTNNSDKTNW